MRKYLKILLSVSLLTTSGCSLLKASAVKETVFIPKPEVLTENRERAPFSGYWVSDPKKFLELRETYSMVFIDDVDTSKATEIYQKASGSEKTKQKRIEEVKELAIYFKERLKIALRNTEDNDKTKFIELEISEEIDENGLALKLALTQVVPTNPGINLAGTVAGYFVPGGGLIKYFGEGSVAMEGFVEEEPDSLLHSQFSDREGQKTYPFSLKDYQRYAHIRVALDDWADQIAEILTTPPEHKVEDSLPFSVNPF